MLWRLSIYAEPKHNGIVLMSMLLITTIVSCPPYLDPLRSTYPERLLELSRVEIKA